MIFRATWGVLCISFLAGCASMQQTTERLRTNETAYFQAVEERREPKDFLFVYEDPDAYIVALGSVELASGEGAQQKAVQAGNQACLEELEKMLPPRIVEMLGRYGQWFTPAERREDSELVARLSAQLARASLKFWGRFYMALDKYQVLRCVHRSQIEVDILSDALIRERDQGGTGIEMLVRRMERRQAEFISASRELGIQN